METSIGALISGSGVRYANKTALIVNGRTYSFSEIEHLSSAVATRLQQQGYGRGATVSICAPNSAEWIIAYYGIMKAGCIVNPLNLMLTAPEMAYALVDCGASVLFGLSEKLLSVRALLGDKSPLLVSFDGEADDLELFEGWSGTSVGSVLEFDQDLRSEISTVVYTSGTTGKPKGALLTHRAVLLNVAMTATMHGKSEIDTVVSALPLSHVYGNVVMQCAIAYGMTLVLHSTFSAEEVLESIEKHRATIFEGVPTMYMYLLDFPRLADYDLTSLSRCTVGGQTMPLAQMREVETRFGTRLLELWGMTELGGLGITHPVLGEARLGSVGLPFPCVQAGILAPSVNGQLLPVGQVGELVIKGPLTMLGYLNNPEATAEAIDSSGYLHTGDLAYMDDDGYVFVVDRLTDMIITAGFNIYPAELEGVLCEHPAVAMAAVVGVRDPVKGELAKAFVVLSQGCQLTEQELLDFCRTRLAAYKMPRLVTFVDDLPKTGSGKILRRVLRQ
ncbi:Long-chain-fatty-acid--CoA ligase [Pseudomonas extremaustralis]|uniref:Long-chain-fatty-acid--CoA ligase n=1 Tax=Pseudomonas extremaustralis TaxID=359110 RepID=A0A5M9J4E4_9PSED|nr:AMP-binding protein [Pseudomonas extremaustralis]KAA8562856.1 Long-chain-fatty-acid--CoA ligase [Pseudomonas extremaustralis]